VLREGQAPAKPWLTVVRLGRCARVTGRASASATLGPLRAGVGSCWHASRSPGSA
jgi:hypothetical protein